jgi:hypothetical protein
MSEAVISTLQSNNGRRNFSAANQMRDVSGNAGDIAATAFAGCYQISPDSVWQSGLFPQRFALQAAPQGGSGLQHAVRSVSADGRIDSVLAGSDWHVVVPGMANVSFASSIGPQRLNLQLAPTGSVTATTPTDAGLRGLTVLRPKCVP